MKTTILITDISFDTDGDRPLAKRLAKKTIDRSVIVEHDVDEDPMDKVADIISNRSGFCVNSFTGEKFDRYVIIHEDNATGEVRVGIIQDDAFLTVDIYDDRDEAVKELADAMISQWEEVEEGEREPEKVIAYEIVPCKFEGSVRLGGEITFMDGSKYELSPSLV